MARRSSDINERKEKKPQTERCSALCKDKKSHKPASISRAAYLQKSAHERAKTIQKPLQRDAEAKRLSWEQVVYEIAWSAAKKA
jgi:hypothetical protein